ncbi:PA0069 family radical SAM protein [Thiobacter aerophilum]|uniref:PA0069 family radical SAM protein n=1 Tax=Thiobacter aerophilum TaxID=3121275 RepID=A0ABV0EB74_9BURK
MSESAKFRNLRKGRGAASNPDGRFESLRREREDDGWGSVSEETVLATVVGVDRARRVITYNDSPDIPFDRSINPYRGCEHGCIYCFARPSHGYLGLSAGQDFESRLFYKPDAPERLREELAHPRYRCQPIALGINTDGWQPAERRLALTRRLLEVLAACRHPVSIVTKSALIERDLDLLTDLARDDLVHVFVSLTTLDRELARCMEPRAAQPERRLAVIETLARAGVPVGVMVAPVIPVLTDPELESILQRARAAGAQEAGYAVLRLPHEVKNLFREWLASHRPLAAQHVMSRVRELNGGKDYEAAFGVRLVGSGPYARFLRDRFRLAYRRLGFPGLPVLATDRFRPPATSGQMSLF